MSNAIVALSTGARNSSASLVYADRDPRKAADFVEQIVNESGMTYREMRDFVRTLGTPQNEWQTAILNAAERLARIAIDADFERVMAAADRRIAYERAERDRIASANGGRYCRQCKRWNACGHVAPKGR